MEMVRLIERNLTDPRPEVKRPPGGGLFALSECQLNDDAKGLWVHFSDSLSGHMPMTTSRPEAEIVGCGRSTPGVAAEREPVDGRRGREWCWRLSVGSRGSRSAPLSWPTAASMRLGQWTAGSSSIWTTTISCAAGRQPCRPRFPCGHRPVPGEVSDGAAQGRAGRHPRLLKAAVQLALQEHRAAGQPRRQARPPTSLRSVQLFANK